VPMRGGTDRVDCYAPLHGPSKAARDLARSDNLFCFGSAETTESFADQRVFSEPSSIAACRSFRSIGQVQPTLCRGKQPSFLVRTRIGFGEFKTGRRALPGVIFLTHRVVPTESICLSKTLAADPFHC